jgi:hypothetical protein
LKSGKQRGRRRPVNPASPNGPTDETVIARYDIEKMKQLQLRRAGAV